MEQKIIKSEPHKWLDLYGDMMFQYVLPRVNDNAIAEDIIQETFLSALKGLSGYKGESSEKNWLFTILKNKIIDHYRRKSKEQVVTSMPDLKSLDNEWFNEEGSWDINRMPGDWSVANNVAERKEIQKIISWCKDHLKAVQRDVFTLKYLEDLNSEQICKVLNISSSNYWVLIHRARLQMRDCVEQHWLKS